MAFVHDYGKDVRCFEYKGISGTSRLVFDVYDNAAGEIGVVVKTHC